MKLNDINKEPYFKVPEDYFENFDEQLRKKIEAKPARVFWLPKSTFYKLATVSTIIAIALISVFYFQSKNTTNVINTAQNTEQSNVSPKAIINYLSGNNISLDEIADFMQENNIDIYQDSTSQIQSDSGNAAIENYLINNDIDEQTIINSL